MFRILWQIVWFVPSMIIGYLVPLEITSRSLLNHELNKRGMSWRSIPDACLAELSRDTLDMVRFIHKQNGFPLRQLLILQTERVADRLTELLGVTPVQEGRFYDNDMSHVVSVMKRFGIRPVIFPYNEF
jgi:hypothetical protein